MAKGRRKKKINPLLPLVILLLAAIAVLAVLLVVLDDGTAPDPDADVSATTTQEVTTTTKPSVAGVYVTTDSLNVRSGPGTNYEILTTLSPGATVEVLDGGNGWYRISYKGEVAYVSADYVTPSAASTAKPTEKSTEKTAEKTAASTATKASTSVTGSQYKDRYIDADGMLQFEAGDNYVQKKSAEKDTPWYLLLVNDWNPMEEGYDEQVTMKTVDRKAVNNSQKVDARMYDDLMKMLDAGKKYNIGVQSSYRSYATQKRLYNNKVTYYKGIYSDPVVIQSKAGEVVKRPGFSEHNTGLAVDLYGSGDHSLTESFAKTEAYKWLMANCADYGFILRFPKGKESVTGVIYEAWHFRYVGDAEIAHEIMDNGLCLEEYLEQTKQ